MLGREILHLHDRTPGVRHEESSVDFLTYTAGLVFAIGLTIVSFVIVKTNLLWGPGIPVGLVVLAFAWGALTIVFGLTQEQILPDTGHWVVQILHLLVGIGAVGQAENIGRRLRQGRTAPAPVAAQP